MRIFREEMEIQEEVEERWRGCKVRVNSELVVLSSRVGMGDREIISRKTKKYLF